MKNWSSTTAVAGGVTGGVTGGFDGTTSTGLFPPTVIPSSALSIVPWLSMLTAPVTDASFLISPTTDPVGTVIAALEFCTVTTAFCKAPERVIGHP